MDKPVLVKVYDHESNGKHVLMGQFETSVNGLVRSGNSHTEIKLKKTGKETGTIVVKKAEVAGIQDLTSKMAAAQVSPPPPSVPSPTVAYVPAPSVVVPPVAQSARSDQPTFVDYVIGGCDLQVAVAIDFTGSNGKLIIVGVPYTLRTNRSLIMFPSLDTSKQAIHESLGHCTIITRMGKRMITKKQFLPSYIPWPNTIRIQCFRCGVLELSMEAY